LIRFGIIGTNWITDRLLKAAMQVEDFSLKAVYSRTSEKAEEFAAKYGVDLTYTDLDSMAKSDEIDAVYIASPNSLHAEQAILFMNHKKHVLCEKPLASNVSEITKMIQAAKENRVLLMEAMKSTLLPNFKSIQENLHKIGTVRRYVAGYCQYSSRYDAYRSGKVLNAFDPSFSNGSLMDIGIYTLYPSIVLFGKPETIKASGLLLSSGVDGEGSILLQYKDKDAVMMYSKITDSNMPSEIQGEEGSIIIDRISTIGKVEIRYRDGRFEDISRPQKEDTMYYEMKEFVDLIQNDLYESKINTYENSIKVMEVMDEARKQIGVVYPADKI
jgi:predicted dehydrogenase